MFQGMVTVVAEIPIVEEEEEVDGTTTSNGGGVEEVDVEEGADRAEVEGEEGVDGSSNEEEGGDEEGIEMAVEDPRTMMYATTALKY